MQYTICENTNYRSLVEEVQDLIERNWTPIGGVAMVSETWEDGHGHHSQVLFAQAMIKQDEAQ